MIYEHVCADDDFTHGISIGPVGLPSTLGLRLGTSG